MKNKRLISFGLPLIVASVSILIVVLFNALVQRNIENKAIDSLYGLEVIQDSEVSVYTILGNEYEEEYYLDVYVIPIDEADEIYFFPTENELYEYYKLNKDLLMLDTVYEYAENGKHVFFMLSGTEDNNTTNVYNMTYVNITPLLDTMATANSVLIIVLVFVVLGMTLLGNRVGHMIAENEKNLKNFFSNASHELKTPIMAIQGYAEGIEAGVVEEKQAANVILKESERMSHLVGDILELSKLDSGALKLNLQNTDIREILYEIIDANEFHLKEKDVTLEFELSEVLMANCDERLIHSVLSNILDNTIRYAEHKVTLQTRKIPNYIIVEIRNDGVPIADEEKAHIFDRFYKGKQGQTGIGMALAKEYMDLHNGTIKISTTEKETIFIVGIPTLK